MRAVLAGSVEGREEHGAVQSIVAVAIAHSPQAALVVPVTIDDGVERTVRPCEALRLAAGDVDALDDRAGARPEWRRDDAVERAVLIGSVEAPAVVARQAHPRSFANARHGVHELGPETIGEDELIGRQGEARLEGRRIIRRPPRRAADHADDRSGRPLRIVEVGRLEALALLTRGAPARVGNDARARAVRELDRELEPEARAHRLVLAPGREDVFPAAHGQQHVLLIGCPPGCARGDELSVEVDVGSVVARAAQRRLGGRASEHEALAQPSFLVVVDRGRGPDPARLVRARERVFDAPRRTLLRDGRIPTAESGSKGEHQNEEHVSGQAAWLPSIVEQGCSHGFDAV